MANGRTRTAADQYLSRPPLHTLWPFVMITSPADHRLAVGSDDSASANSSTRDVRASMVDGIALIART